MAKRWAWLAALSGLVLVSVGGCGGDDEFQAPPSEKCTPNAAECVTQQAARVCPADGSRWISYPCAPGDSCNQTAGVCASSIPCTADSPPECVTPEISRVCSNEVWLTLPCNSGETCDAATGTCGGCTPGSRACATTTVAQVCQSDSTYVPFACAKDEICDTTTGSATYGECIVDVLGGVCEPGTAKCQGGEKSLKCKGGGEGYEVTTCPITAPCRDGLCTGEVCSLGESFCDTSLTTTPSTRIKSCVNGDSWKYADCPPGQVCAARRDNDYSTAACVKRVCTPGTAKCGSPTDATVDTAGFVSRCEQLNDGSYDWVLYECSELESCDPEATTATCSKICTPRAQRCTTTSHGYQECNPEGTWGPVVECNASISEPQRQCMPKPGLISGDLATVVCGDPVCKYLASLSITTSSYDYAGACEGTKIRLCDSAGRLADVSAAQTCPTGICSSVSTVKYGGVLPATCKQDCKAGDERCLGPTSPLYQTCIDGVWSIETERCPNSDVCWGYTDNNVQKKLCGGECTPGSRKCEGTSILTCSAQGKWGPAEVCALGSCKSTSGIAACTVDCVPSTKVCTGTTKLASDGISSGTSAELLCNPDGTLPSTTAAVSCPGTTTCRTTRTGVALGCVECIGPNAPGGNALGMADAYCPGQGTENNSVQICGSNDDWSNPLTCPLGEVCKTTGTALSQTCGSCSYASPCSQATVMASYGSLYTCSFIGYGSPISCGGYSDCCSAACITSGVTVAAAYCGPA